MMMYREIHVIYESIRKWGLEFAQSYTTQIRRNRPKPSDKWHFYKVVLKIQGTQYYLWQAVDQNGQYR